MCPSMFHPAVSQRWVITGYLELRAPSVLEVSWHCVWLWERTCRKCCLLSQNKPGCSLQNGWVDLAYICHCDWFIRCIFSETNVHFNWSLDCVELNRNWMLAVSTARRRNAAFDASQKWGPLPAYLHAIKLIWLLSSLLYWFKFSSAVI